MRLLLVFGFVAGKLWSCVCGVSPTGTPPCQSAWNYAAVFTGTVLDITEPEPGPRMIPLSPGDRLPEFPQRKVQFQVTERLAGVSPDQKQIVIETGLGGGDCGYGFRRGFDYIVYASKKPGGGLSTGICSPTRPIEKAAEDLKYFHQLAIAPATAEIRVTAFDADQPWVRGNGGGPAALAGLAGVRVVIDGAGTHESSTTDQSGRHVFAELPAGEYNVDASLDGYLKAEGLRPVRVHSKGCAEVPLALRLDRSVTGRVLGADGLPASGVIIEAVPFRPRMENDMPFAADSSTTDAEGRYALRHLRAGDYYVGISISRPPTAKYPYARWFFPGTEDPAKAAILHVTDRPESQAFDVTIPARLHDRVIQGVVLWPDGRPAEHATIFVEDPRWPWQAFNVAAMTDSQGQFTVNALDATRSRIHAYAAAAGASAIPAPIEPGADPVKLRLVLVRTGSSLRDNLGKGLEDWRKGLGLH